MTNDDLRRRRRAFARSRRLLLLDERRLHRPLGVLGLVLLLAALTMPSLAGAQTPAWVDTGGDCLRMRTAPGLDAPDIRCLQHGAAITLLAGVQELDGFTWREIEYKGQRGWVADFYITTDQAEVQPLHEPVSESGLPEPPPGGLTMGAASVTDPASMAASLSYPVVSIWHFEIASQRWLRFIPGAPPLVNTLSSLTPGDVVTVRRGGSLSTVGALPEASLTVAGTPNVLPVPPVGGLTQGVSGTTDPRFLAQAQTFAVQSVAYFHVGSQRWLLYIPGAPERVNSLQQGQLRIDSVVTVRRGPDAPTTEPTSEESDRFETTITYYYCVPGSNPAGIGDAGGYCGTMANGERVHAGAAACAARHLGQRFRIEGDPTGRIYTCTDIGGSVLQDHRDIWFMNSDDGYAWWQGVGERAFVQLVHE